MRKHAKETFPNELMTDDSHEVNTKEEKLKLNIIAVPNPNENEVKSFIDDVHDLPKNEKDATATTKISVRNALYERGKLR